MRRYEDWDDAGLLAACWAAYKKAGCCLMLGRYDDALSESKVTLEALRYALDKGSGWGRDVMGEWAAGDGSAGAARQAVQVCRR